MADGPALTGYEALLADLEPLVKALPSNSPPPPPMGKRPKVGADGKPMMRGDGKPMMERPKMGTDGRPMMKSDGTPDMEDDDEEDDTFGKALKVTVDGKEVEVIDATEMMKALHTENVDIKGGLGQLVAAFTKSLGQNAEMAKSLTALGTTIATQDVLIKSLQDKVEKFGNAGGGSRSAFILPPGGPARPAEPKTEMKADEFMGLVMKSFENGKIGGTDVATIEDMLGRGQTPTAEQVAFIVKTAS